MLSAPPDLRRYFPLHWKIALSTLMAGCFLLAAPETESEKTDPPFLNEAEIEELIRRKAPYPQLALDLFLILSHAHSKTLLIGSDVEPNTESGTTLVTASTQRTISRSVEMIRERLAAIPATGVPEIDENIETSVQRSKNMAMQGAVHVG